MKEELFRGKTLGDILSDIYSHSSSTRGEILSIIREYSNLVKSPSDAVNIGPIITSLLEVSVKNDDQLSKVATIAQRIIVASARGAKGSDGMVLTEREREALLKEAHEDLEDALSEIDDIDSSVSKIKSSKKDKDA